jgi:hypothetical protein
MTLWLASPARAGRLHADMICSPASRHPPSAPTATGSQQICLELKPDFRSEVARDFPVYSPSDLMTGIDPLDLLEAVRMVILGSAA